MASILRMNNLKFAHLMGWRFLTNVINKSTSTVREGDDAKARVERRVTRPMHDLLGFYETYDFNGWIDSHLTFVKHTLDNPFDSYTMLRDRLKMNGIMASFPEFKGVVGYLIKSIFQSKEIYDFYNSTDDRRCNLELLIHQLIAINTETRYEFPYAPTIFAITRMLEMIDVYYRTIDPHKYAPYYHNFRYRVYLDHIVYSESPNNIVFPTIRHVGATDLIRIRCVPILFLGVVNEPNLADMYYNTPIDFMAHDVQHEGVKFKKRTVIMKDM